ncbi:MAG: DUF4339 domain-containing protein [Lentisphaerae bacterium]|nr:DUF4339 domain-containing protein [Lentisphaerota bacterium]
MDWYYTTASDEQVGPVDESTIQGLINNGTISKVTPVWNEALPEWIDAGGSVLANLFPAVKAPPPRPKPSSATQPATQSADSFTRDDSLVYSANPPRSPHQAWLNIMAPGVAQIFFGKTKVGLICMGAAQALNALGNFHVQQYNETEAQLCGLLYLALLVASIVDAYMTGNRLSEGHPVGKKQVFPTRKPTLP